MKILAHRGASYAAPENTLKAIKLALHQGADGIEVDIRQHGQELLVLHDATVDRTTNGTGNLNALTLQYIRSLNAGAGQPIPTLSEVIACICGNTLLNIEVKSCQQVSLLIEHWHMAQKRFEFQANQLVVSSFDHHLLKQLKRQCPQMQIGALTASKPVNYAQFAQALQAFSVNVAAELVDKAFVEDAHQRNMPLWAYTVDCPDEMHRLNTLGVDGIFTNRPDLAQKVLS